MLAVDFAEDDVDGADQGNDVGEEFADGHDFQRLEVHEAGRAFVPAVGAVGSVADDVETEFAFGALDAGVCFTDGGRETAGPEFEVVDDGLHGVVEFLAAWGSDLFVEGVPIAFGEAVDGLAEDLDGLFHFGHADEEAVVDVSYFADGDFEIEVFIGAIGLGFAEVEGDSGRAGDRAGTAEFEGFFSGEDADLLGAFFEDGVFYEEVFDDLEFFREFFEELVQLDFESGGDVAAEATGDDPGGHHADAGEHLEHVEDHLALLHDIEEGGHGAEVEGTGS